VSRFDGGALAMQPMPVGDAGVTLRPVHCGVPAHMVMLLRLLWTWLTHRLRGPLEPLGTAVLQMRVWPQDVDLNVHMNNGCYFSAADIGRIDWWLRTGLWRRFMRRGWRPVAGNVTGRFMRSLQPLQRYELHTRLLGWNRKWLFAEHRFVARGEVHAVVVVRYLFVNRRGPRPAPAEVLRLAGWERPSPSLPRWVEAWSEGQDGAAAGGAA
jgi:acyl-CoA thioesterase FadM